MSDMNYAKAAPMWPWSFGATVKNVGTESFVMNIEFRCFRFWPSRIVKEQGAQFDAESVLYAPQCFLSVRTQQ
jgi:hypothetical protein